MLLAATPESVGRSSGVSTGAAVQPIILASMDLTVTRGGVIQRPIAANNPKPRWSAATMTRTVEIHTGSATVEFAGQGREGSLMKVLVHQTKMYVYRHPLTLYIGFAPFTSYKFPMVNLARG